MMMTIRMNRLGRVLGVGIKRREKGGRWLIVMWFGGLLLEREREGGG